MCWASAGGVRRFGKQLPAVFVLCLSVIYTEELVLYGCAPIMWAGGLYTASKSSVLKLFCSYASEGRFFCPPYESEWKSVYSSEHAYFVA